MMLSQLTVFVVTLRFVVTFHHARTVLRAICYDDIAQAGGRGQAITECLTFCFSAFLFPGANSPQR